MFNFITNLKIDKRLLSQLDFGMLFLAIIITIFSSINIYSATYSKTLDGQLIGADYMKLQLTWLCIGLVVVYLLLTFDYSWIQNFAYFIYGSSIVLLLLNIAIGSVSKGAQSWIKIGSRAIQPSEFAKIAIVIVVAKLIDEMEGDINNFKNFMKILVVILIPTALVVIQPDMGMTMVIFFTMLGLVYVAGLDLRIIASGLLGIIAMIAIVWNSGLIEDYQKNRLISFINTSSDQLGTGYHLIQSQIGIGSGGILGKGFLQGTQTNGGFIPEAWTDFIFAVVGEEWGLIGAIVLLSVYGIFLYRMLKISRTSKDIFGSLVCAGIGSSMIFSILENIGMCIGIMPITGITLPFMSYGGSSLLTNFISLGIVLNIGMRRKKLNF